MITVLFYIYILKWDVLFFYNINCSCSYFQADLGNEFNKRIDLMHMWFTGYKTRRTFHTNNLTDLGSVRDVYFSVEIYIAFFLVSWN